MTIANPTKRFKGINNITDPMRLGLDWLTRADNVNITDTGGITKRKGFQRVLTADARSAYTTLDFSRMYLQDGTTLCEVLEGLSLRTLVSGLSGAPLCFTEVNGLVYFSDQAGDAGIITPAGDVLPLRWEVPPQPHAIVGTGALPAGLYRVAYAYVLADGRETGLGGVIELDLPSGSRINLVNVPQMQDCRTLVYVGAADSTSLLCAGVAGESFSWDGGPDSLGVESFGGFAEPMPRGVTQIAAHAGRIFAALPMPEHDQSAVWASMPLAPHLWNLERDFFMVPGQVLMLAPSSAGLLVGTDRGIYSYAVTERALRQLAPYGVVPGHAWAQEPTGATYFWTQRGLCAYPDFKNLTLDSVSVAPGIHAAGALVQEDGQLRFVAALRRGGAAFNPLN